MDQEFCRHGTRKFRKLGRSTDLALFTWSAKRYFYKFLHTYILRNTGSWSVSLSTFCVLVYKNCNLFLVNLFQHIHSFKEHGASPWVMRGNCLQRRMFTNGKTSSHFPHWPSSSMTEISSLLNCKAMLVASTTETTWKSSRFSTLPGEQFGQRSIILRVCVTSSGFASPDDICDVV